MCTKSFYCVDFCLFLFFFSSWHPFLCIFQKNCMADFFFTFHTVNWLLPAGFCSWGLSLIRGHAWPKQRRLEALLYRCPGEQPSTEKVWKCMDTSSSCLTIFVGQFWGMIYIIYQRCQLHWVQIACSICILVNTPHVGVFPFLVLLPHSHTGS